MFIETLLSEANPFTSYTLAHIIPLVIFTLVGFISICYANRYLSGKGKRNLGTGLALICSFAVIMRIIMTIISGEFSLQEELPLHICRVMALTIPFAMYYRHRKWMGVFYFMILAGTFQANITPDITYGFPHHSYITYWLLHAMLVVVPIYSVFVYKFRFDLKDLWRAFFVTNVYMVLITIYNLLTDSNYMYTLRKPPVATMLDLFGPWPWYLVVAEFIALLLFFLFYLPFAFRGNKAAKD